jgi:mono/diheme cytochrome c family protein
MKLIIYEILILLAFWFSIHTFCRSYLEPKINSYNNVNQTDSIIDNRDEDDTLIEITTLPEYIDSGKVLFFQKCACCHSFDRDLAGPKLNDSISFKHFNESVKDIGDLAKRYKHTGELYNKWNLKFMGMPKFNEELNETQIEYIKSYTVHTIKNNTR